MPSQLVNDVRALIRERSETGQPITDLERTFILSALGTRVRAGGDVVDELEAAIAETRTLLTVNTPEGPRRIITRLLAAARAALDYTPAPTAPAEVLPPEVADADPLGGRPPRADVDG